MILNGKTLSAFKEWLKINYPDKTYGWFTGLPDSAKYGVYVDFFDSVGIYVMDLHNEISRTFYYDISTKPMSDDITSDHIFTRHEARTKAIEKAVEIYNQQ